MEIGIVTFKVGHRTFRFKDPLMLEASATGARFTLIHKKLNLSALGTSWSECEEIIREQLAIMWKEYVLYERGSFIGHDSAFGLKLMAMTEEVTWKK